MAEPPKGPTGDDGPASGLDDTAIAAPSDPGPAAATSQRIRVVHAGDALGRYTLDEEIGEGGMATVFRARDAELRREVAIKVMFPHLARREETVRRFQREARAAAGLEHPNILRIYDVGGGAGGEPPFIVMELIRGRSLLAEIEQRAPLLAELAACIGALLADALGAAHAAGIVHRDVKPANILIAPGGRLLLADFGVARLETEDSLVTKTGAVLGTPAYMSPEQASGDTSTRKSDLYSLGATLYQLATGSLPYSGSPAKVLAAIAAGGHAPAMRRTASVGAELSRVIDRLMAVDPATRPADAQAVASELRAIAAGGGFGEPAEELAAYFADPEGFVRARTPVVTAAVVAAAERALAEARLPRALALADRAAALAPQDPAVVALVARVTAGGRATSRRRVLALAGAGLALAGGAALGARALFASPDAPVAALDAAAPRVVAPPSSLVDAAALAIDAPPPIVVDAAVAVSVAPRDAAAPRPRPDAAALDAAVPDAAPPDAPPAPDAAPAPPADGTLVVSNDTWCDLVLDGARAARLTPPRATLRAAAGHHTLRCEQRDQGREWHREIDVPPGATVPVAGTLLAALTVSIGNVRGTLAIDGSPYARGAVVHLSHGSHRFETPGGAVQRLDIATDCVLGERLDDRGAATLECVAVRP